MNRVLVAILNTDLSLPYFMRANSEGSDETARMRRLTWAFDGRLCNKYHNLMNWLLFQIVLRTAVRTISGNVKNTLEDLRLNHYFLKIF